MTTIAAIDCGTNSIRLLIARIADDGTLTELDRRMRIVRLGQGVDRTGRLAPEALERTAVVLADYTAAITAAGVERVRMVATSATRDAANRADFDTMVQRVLGRPAEVISGAEEAALSFGGAVSALPDPDGPGPVLVVDIGGGSTEFVLGDASTATVTDAFSMDVGSVRMTERHFADDPPTAEQQAAAERDVSAALDAQPVPVERARRIVGVAGTITTLAALAQELPSYQRERVHGYRLSAAEIERLTAQLLAMDRSARAALPSLHAGRVDVIAAGALVLRTVVRRAAAETVLASEHDILDGIAATLV